MSFKDEIRCDANQTYQRKEEEFIKRAQEYAAEIEKNDGIVTRRALQDKFLEAYYNGGKIESFKFDNEKSHISNAINKLLEQRGIGEENIYEEFMEIARGHLGTHRYTSETLVAMISEDKYFRSGDKFGPLRWQLDDGYVKSTALKLVEEMEMKMEIEQGTRWKLSPAKLNK